MLIISKNEIYNFKRTFDFSMINLNFSYYLISIDLEPGRNTIIFFFFTFLTFLKKI